MSWRLKHISQQDVIAAAGYSLLFGLVYASFYLACGDPFEYGGEVFSVVLIWVCAQVLGLLFQLVKLPALLGMLVAGMVLQNAVPALVAGMPDSWSDSLRAMALGTIFLRSGLELDLKVFKCVGPVATRLLLLPGLIEAFTDGGVAMGVFRMPVFYAFTLGFILKAVGPAIVIQTMFELQRAGLGVAKGIPSIIVAAASFDDMVAITGYSLFSNLAIRDPDSNLVYQLLHGPMDIAFGVLGGLAGAMLCSCTRLWNTRGKRTLVVFASAQGLLFLLYHFGFKAGGALATLVLGLLVNVLWAQGRHVPLAPRIPGYLALPPSEHFSHEVEHVVGQFWRFVAQPLLFGLIGTMMDFRKPGFEASFLPKSLAIIATGLAVRIPATFFAMAGAGLTLKERLFVAVAWTPKATVQAALGALPLSTIKEVYGEDSPDVVIGEQILTTSILAILICAPGGVMGINMTKRALLEKVGVRVAGGSPRAAATPPAGALDAPDASSPGCGGQPESEACAERGAGSALAAAQSAPHVGRGEASGAQAEAAAEAEAARRSRDEATKQPAVEAPPDVPPPPAGPAAVRGSGSVDTAAQLSSGAGGESAAAPAAGAPAAAMDAAAAAQELYERRLLSEADGDAAAQLTRMEAVADALMAEGRSEAADTLRNSVRALRKRLLEGVQPAEDSELATSFFRYASLVHPAQAPPAAAAAAPEAELTHVAVARGA